MLSPHCARHLPGRPLHAARAGLAVLALLAALHPRLAVASPPAGGRYLPLVECRLPHPGGLGSVPARCGSLSVPEDPSDPDGRRIGLRVAVVPAVDRRAREPLFIIAGGPGQAATDFYAGAAAAFAPVQRNRDLVLVDQRGTGGSNRLDCAFPDDFEVREPSPAELRALSTACRLALPGRPQFYTTSVAVRDLEAVRAALGYPRIALYGVSYGTRVAQHYLRRYGAHVHAVVLDGVVAPDRTLGPETPFDAQRALDLLFARCAHDAACNQAFPELPQRFDALRARLRAHAERVTVDDPVSGFARTLDFDAEALVAAVRLLDYYSITASLLPLFIDRAARGDLKPIAGQLLLFAGNLDSQLAYGMNAAVSCTEDAPALARVDRESLAHTYLGASQLDGLAALCDGWPHGVVDPDLFAPLTSGVPTLLLSGEADPVTPPASAARAAAHLGDARQIVVAGQGHGQLSFGCAPRVVAAFLDAGTARGLDATCLESASAPPFVLDYAGPGP